MADKFFSRRNLDFLLYDVLGTESLTRWDRYADHNRKGFDLMLDAAADIASKLLRPVLTEMDQDQPELVNGRVRVHPVVKKWLRECGRGGWVAAGFPYDHGGEQIPEMITGACRFIFAAANYSASVYPELSAGAAHLLTSFGSPELVETFVPKLLDGKWQGTMALTEPQAGSSLSDITTEAVPADNGAFYVRGTKIFISAGDHDAVENVVHLMLARIPGAPAGVRGISLFAVPRLRPENGSLVGNDVEVSQIYHKLGYRGAPITELSIGQSGNCIGYLVGEPNRGLASMFQMMNEARVGVGLGAAAIASAAYYAALDYAAGRVQGRRPGDKDPASPPLPIIDHADVRRMLLFQRAVVEGSLGLLLQCSQYADLARVAPEDDAEMYLGLLDLLTPVAKSYPSEMGILATSAGIQCLGGYGYCEDFPLQQYFRDIRIHPIHEGTTGIQGMDLLGRKVLMHEGKWFRVFLENIEQTTSEAAAQPAMAGHGQRLSAAAKRLETVTMHLVELAMTKAPDVFLADAVLYLELFGLVTIGWQWLRQGITAERCLADADGESARRFYSGKMLTCDYFFAYELPKTLGLAERLVDGNPMTVNMNSELFQD